MKKRHLILIIISFLSIVSFSIFMLVKKSKEHKYQISDFEEQLEFLSISIELKQDKINTYINNLFVHFKSDVTIENTDYESFLLKNIISKNEKLCLYFTEYMCVSCVESQINHFKSLEDKIGIDQLCFLVSFENLERLKNINKRYLTKIPFYHIDEKENPFDNILNSPVVFILNKDLTTKSIFFPETELSPLNEIYYNSIETHFTK